jgi:hypothetical protein
MKNAGESAELQEQMFHSMRLIRAAQQKAQREFAFLRNSTIAHRDADALLQYRSIMEIDEIAVMRLAAEFFEASRMFHSVLPRVTVEVGTMPGLLRQVSSHRSNRTAV